MDRRTGVGGCKMNQGGGIVLTRETAIYYRTWRIRKELEATVKSVDAHMKKKGELQINR